MDKNKPNTGIIAEYHSRYNPEVTMACQGWADRNLRKNLISQSDWFVNTFKIRNNVISMYEPDPEVKKYIQNYIERTAGAELPNITWEKYFNVLKMTALFNLHQFYDKYSFYLEKFLAPGRVVELVNLAKEYPTAKFVKDLFLLLKKQFELYKDVIYSLEPEEFLFCLSNFKFSASKNVFMNLLLWMNEDLAHRGSLWPELVKHLNLRNFNEVRTYNYMFNFGIALENCYRMQKTLVEKLMVDQTNLFLARKNSIESYSKEDFGDIVLTDVIVTGESCNILKVFRYKGNTCAVFKESTKTYSNVTALYLLITGQNFEERCLGKFEKGFQISMFGSSIFVVVPGIGMTKQKDKKATSIYEFDVNNENRVLVHHIQIAFKPNVVVVCKSFLYLLYYNQSGHYEQITRYNRQSGNLCYMVFQVQEPIGRAWEGVTCHSDRLIIFRQRTDLNDPCSRCSKELEVYIDEFPTWRILRVPVPWNSFNLILDFYDEDVKSEEEANWSYVYVNFLCDGNKMIYHFNPESKTFMKSKIILHNSKHVKNRAHFTVFLDITRKI